MKKLATVVRFCKSEVFAGYEFGCALDINSHYVQISHGAYGFDFNPILGHVVLKFPILFVIDGKF